MSECSNNCLECGKLASGLNSKAMVLDGLSKSLLDLRYALMFEDISSDRLLQGASDMRMIETFAGGASELIAESRKHHTNTHSPHPINRDLYDATLNAVRASLWGEESSRMVYGEIKRKRSE